MKKSILSILAVTALLFTSCSSDDSTSPAGPVAYSGGTVLSGVISTNVTLDASKAYTLPGSLFVANGGALTIPAGTKITAAAGGTSTYIGVLKGGDIFINGTATNPVVMSSADGTSGDWGGLTICGDATTTEGVDATAEVGGFIYGGTNDTDSSGSIECLVIKGTGAAINGDSEYNGISFYAVGSETKVENIAVIDGSDDGVEFFGGTVNAKNMYLENNNDDSVDWTEGWNGTVENVYISHTKSGFSTAFEADGANNNPTFKNVTAISTVAGTALQFKKTSGATITGLYLSGYATDLDLKAAGTLSDVKIDGATATVSATLDATALKYTLTSTLKDATKVDISTWTWKDATL